MSYAKLASSILDSTIWLESHHVVRVWIAMMAMKDQDGVVGAAVPGLAVRARVTLAECEEALAKFMAPDPYSRTKDFEGRRIVEVDGGWRLLNHLKYRDLDSVEERRRKDAERQHRKRERDKLAEDWAFAKGGERDESRDVTPGHVRSRHTDTDTQADPDTEDPDCASGEIANSHACPIPPGPPAPHVVQQPEESSAPPPTTVPQPARQKLNHDAWQEAKLAHDLVRSQGLDPGARAWSAMPSGAAAAELAARTTELLEAGDEASARATHAHVIAVRLAEAKQQGSLKYFTPSRVYARDSFWKAAELSVAQVTQARPPPNQHDPRPIRIVRHDEPPAGLEDPR